MNFLLKRQASKSTFAVSDLSAAEKQMLLQEALTKTLPVPTEEYSPHCWISDVYDDFVIYSLYGLESGTYKREYTINDDFSVTWGNPVKVVVTKQYEVAPESNSATMAAFALNANFSMDGESVLRSGKISETGDYPDKGISFSENDFDTAISAFSPVAMDVEHEQSLLDGNLGQLVKVWRDGKSLFGEIRVPSWLNAIFTKDKITPKVSLTWDKKGKRIVGCAWVVNPRIPDAVLMAAFADATIFPKENIGASFRSQKPVTIPSPPVAAQTRKDKPMRKLFETFAAFFTQAANDSPEEGAQYPSVTPTTPAKSAAQVLVPSAGNPEIDSLKAQIAQMNADKVNADAIAFADRAIAEKVALPHERFVLAVQYKQAAQDDATYPVKITFGEGETKVEGTRVEMLSNSVFSRPKHSLLDEVVQGVQSSDNLLIMMGDSKKSDEDMRKARIEATLSATDAGRKTLARMKQEGKL